MESDLFSVEGRIRRSTYWTRAIVATAINILALFFAISDPSARIVYLIVMFLISVFSIIQVVKRLHDVGKSGWMYFIVLIPIIGPFWLLFLLFTDSTPGNNEYGENPKEKNPQEDELNNIIMTLLISSFVTCGIYALLTITNIIIVETVKNMIFIISFTACNLYFLTWYINKNEQKNLKNNENLTIKSVDDQKAIKTSFQK